MESDSYIKIPPSMMLVRGLAYGLIPIDSVPSHMLAEAILDVENEVRQAREALKTMEMILVTVKTMGGADGMQN